jgi:large subunit ribosomal protein L21
MPDPDEGLARPNMVDTAAFAAIVRDLRTGTPRSFGISKQSSHPMFAVIRTGGKQYKVAKDDVITVEKLEGEPGTAVALADVLMIGDGAEARTKVAGARVTAEVVEQIKADKVLIFKKKRRHNYRRKRGHRQKLTVLRVTGIEPGAA